MPTAASVVQTTINTPMKDAFGHIGPIDLTTIFTGYGPLPAVSGTRDQTGRWDTAGRSRTVLFSDGASARESLTGYEFPRRFAYHLDGFTGVLGLLASEAQGEWDFQQSPDGTATTVVWRYEFVSRNRWLAPVLKLFVNSLWSGYMLRALSLTKDQVEGLAASRQ